MIYCLENEICRHQIAIGIHSHPKYSILIVKFLHWSDLKSKQHHNLMRQFRRLPEQWFLMLFVQTCSMKCRFAVKISLSVFHIACWGQINASHLSLSCYGAFYGPLTHRYRYSRAKTHKFFKTATASAEIVVPVCRQFQLWLLQ